MSFLNYRIHWDALFARIVYRWFWQTALVVLLAGSLFSLVSGIIPPVWRGKATMNITAPDAQVLVDGQAWPREIYAGSHTVTARWTDGRVAWTSVEIAADGSQDIALQPGLLTPRVRAIPAAGPGLKVDRIWRADGAWRVVSVPNIVASANTNQQASVRPTALPGQTVAIKPQGLERMSTIDAYKGIADEIHSGDTLIRAWFAAGASANDTRGTVVVQGWTTSETTIPVSQTVSMLRLSPDGKELLVSLQVGNSGEQIALGDVSSQILTPLIAVPGTVTAMEWSPASNAALVTSISQSRLTLTLIRIVPSIVAAVMTEIDIAAGTQPVISTSWTADALFWLASPGADTSATLWKAPLSSLIPESQRPLQAYAFSMLADGSIRILTSQRDQLVVGRLDGKRFTGEAFVPDITPDASLTGTWRGSDILIYKQNQAWLVQFAEQTKE